ncbi:MAG: hypothetical protein KBD63_00715, partial [Bacteriovoracaceae bacterium]|nr:hypothetical protein [Bacteriovoracaceae bacterium]
MNKKILPIRSFIGILFFCVCSPLFAQNQTYSDIDLIHMTEAAIEPNPTLPYGTKFLENFNAPRIIRNLGRVNRLAGDNKTVTHLFQSLAIIFASSHTIEVSIATLAGEAGLTNADWETSHRILASMLSSISLPGLDPLCLFLGYITLRYNLARTVLTKAVSPIRYIAFDVVGTKMTKLIPIEKIFTRGDVLELFNNNRHITYEEKNKNIYVSFITESGKTAIQLNMLRTN